MSQTRPTRRDFAATTAAIALGAIAGCVDDGNGDPEGIDDTAETDDSRETDDATDEVSATPPTDAPGSEGLLYAFAPEEIAIVDPDDGAVVDAIDPGFLAEWREPRIGAEYGEIYVIEHSRNQVVVIDADTRAVAAEIGVGPSPVHLYHPADGELWAHADDEGTFHVIDTTDRAVVEFVEGVPTVEGHGKLLSHPDLGETAYSPNVTYPGVGVVDLAAYERVDTVSFGEAGGTHYKAYAPETGLAYVEYGAETVVLDTATDEIVDQLDVSGAISLSRDETTMAIVDGGTLRFIDATDPESAVISEVDAPGEPSTVRFGTDSATAYAVNTADDRILHVDVADGTAIEELTIDGVDPDTAGMSRRPAVTDGERLFTPAGEAGPLAVVDMDAGEVTATVDVPPGVNQLQYVGDSGSGYSGRAR